MSLERDFPHVAMAFVTWLDCGASWMLTRSKQREITPCVNSKPGPVAFYRRRWSGTAASVGTSKVRVSRRPQT
jgi:hypothetical protein